MPYISVTTNVMLSPEKKSAVKAALGKLISLIPGKDESNLMVSVHDDCSMAFRGEDVSCAYVHTVCYGDTAKEAQTVFVKQMSEMLTQVAGIPDGNVYSTFTDKDSWGVGGTFR